MKIFWTDQIAEKIISKERKLKRVKTLRTEMGIGASGIPHVGSAGDGVRAYSVNLALQDAGAESKFIAFSDDLDGLRKVPFGFPRSLEKEIGRPVTKIPDSYGCHKSFGHHVSSLLIEAFEKIGVKYNLMRASEEYPKGTFDKEIVEILNKWKRVGEIIKEETEQDKFLKQLPFLPVCEKCGRVYTTRAINFDGKKIEYSCDSSFIGKNSNTGKKINVKGCGYKGFSGIRDGKLAWKVDFAARWRALKINYEPYGKDIADSVRVNDIICREILEWDPPVHSFYELFTERGGTRISKSAGNVFTPGMWMQYASPESLRLLFLKRLGTTRVVDPDTIPAFMDEIDELSRIYYGEKEVENKKEEAHLKRLYEYVNFLKPKKPPVTMQYGLLVQLVRIAKHEKVVLDILKRTGHVSRKMSKKAENELSTRIKYAQNWVQDTRPVEKIKYEMTSQQKKAVKILAKELRKRKWTEDSLYTRLFEIPKETDVPISKFFEVAYVILLNSKRGPRLAQFIMAIGPKEIAKRLEETI